MKEILSLETISKVLYERFFADWREMSREDFLDFVRSKSEQALTYEELSKKLETKKKLKIKFGIDPTGPDVHMGHMLPLLLLRQFQKAGHEVNLIIGDFTARIGDPSHRTSVRPALSEKGVKENMKTYLAQIGRFFNVKKAKVHQNAAWLKKLDLSTLLQDFQKLSLTEILQRDDFRKRMEAGQGITLAELLYSYAQGMDSVQINPDVEIGGNDQYLNFAHARVIMRNYGQDPEVGLVTPVLEGTTGDGRKMSKSYNNYIAVSASPEDKFGKIMSIPDNLIFPYFKAFADLRLSEHEEIKRLVAADPLEAKKQLGQFLVAVELQSMDKGKEERERFEAKFSKKTFEGIAEYVVKQDETALDTVHTLVSNLSKSEIKRLFAEEAVRIVEPQERVMGMHDTIPKDSILKIGKKWYFRIK